MVEETKAKPKAKKEKKVAKKPAKIEVTCDDKKCAIHGKITTRGRVFEGTVIAARMQGTVTVEWPRLLFVPKYERFEKRRSRVKAHNPACINAKAGDKVRIAECRPLSKTVKFVIIEVLK